MSNGLWVSSVALLLGLNPSVSRLPDIALCTIEVLGSNLLPVQSSINRYFVLFCDAAQSINSAIHSVPVLPRAPASGKR